MVAEQQFAADDGAVSKRQRVLDGLCAWADSNDAALIVNGSPVFMDASVLGKIANACSMVVAVDSGLNLADLAGLEVSAVVGDLDSVDQRVLQIHRQRAIAERVSSPEKDETDLEMALSYVRDAGVQHAVVANFVGGRLDHELASIGSMSACDLHVVAVDDGCAIWFLSAERDGNPDTLELSRAGLAPGDEYSVLVVDGPAVLTQVGAKYPQDAVEMHGLSGLGISNVVARPDAIVRVERGKAVVIVTF